ncbi:MAG TPA: prepilin-type N-terminal cleavage/methylation domain-containing protein [Candidatus Paceibacterota bacterium]|nr:prepilin-type N-terminal cleavage/methylation domain-containing protein [Candidatus Paceibacterota bacterium]
MRNDIFRGFTTKRAVRGFTLIEAMIAITILTFAVAGPLSAASHALVATEVARDQLTASYLAQEGIEYLRAMRDDAYLAGYPSGSSAAAWTNFVSGSSAASITQCRATTCTLDPSRLMGTGSGLSLEQCSLSGTPYAACAPLYISNNIYTEQSGLAGAVKTAFTRTVQATDISGTDEEIVSTVSWSFHGTPYAVTVTDHLTPWQ